MFRAGKSSHSRGMALFEIVVAVCILGLAAAIASLLASDSRRRARLSGSVQNLQQLGKAAVAFAADRENRAFSFDWTPGLHVCGDYTFPVSTSYTDAAADQAVCILRERAGQTDITAIRGWIPQPFYSPLVLIDYLNDKLPSSVMVSPGDAARLAWQRAVLGHPHDGGAAYFSLTCRPAGDGNESRRWPYSSSYEIQPSFFSPDAIVRLPDGQTIPTFSQSAEGHRYFFSGNALTVLGDRHMDEVMFPSHKALLYESVDRFHGPNERYFMYREARVPVLMADGSATVRAIARANPGFQPNIPIDQIPTRVVYQPELSWETPTASGDPAEFVNGMIRWTRSGLRGRDFAGPEVPWAP